MVDGVVVVPPEAFTLMRKAGLRPPDEGQFGMHDLDAAFSAIEPDDRREDTVQDPLKTGFPVATRQGREHGPSLMVTLSKVSGVSMSGGVRSLVEPFCRGLEDIASAMQAAGVGLSLNGGHVQRCRAMAASMRADAAMGRYPHEYTDRDGRVHAAAKETPVETRVLAMLASAGVTLPEGQITIDRINSLTSEMPPADRICIKTALAAAGRITA